MFAASICSKLLSSKFASLYSRTDAGHASWIISEYVRRLGSKNAFFLHRGSRLTGLMMMMYILRAIFCVSLWNPSLRVDCCNLPHLRLLPCIDCKLFCLIAIFRLRRRLRSDESSSFTKGWCDSSTILQYASLHRLLPHRTLANVLLTFLIIYAICVPVFGGDSQHARTPLPPPLFCSTFVAYVFPVAIAASWSVFYGRFRFEKWSRRWRRVSLPWRPPPSYIAIPLYRKRESCSSGRINCLYCFTSTNQCADYASGMSSRLDVYRHRWHFSTRKFGQS